MYSRIDWTAIRYIRAQLKREDRAKVLDLVVQRNGSLN